MKRRTKEKIASSASKVATQASGGAHLTPQEAQVAWKVDSKFITEISDCDITTMHR